MKIFLKCGCFWLLAVCLAGCSVNGQGFPTDSIPEGTSSQVRENINELKSRDPSRRAQAAIDLGLMGPNARAAIPFLVEILEDARAVQWGCTHGPENKKKSARTVSPGDRAAVALASIADSSVTRLEVIDALTLALSDERMNFRGQANAVLALGKIGASETVPALILTLGAPKFPVRLRAVNALSQIDDPRIIPALMNILSDKNEKVRLKARKAIISITGQDPDIIPNSLEN